MWLLCGRVVSQCMQLFERLKIEHIVSCYKRYDHIHKRIHAGKLNILYLLHNL